MQGQPRRDHGWEHWPGRKAPDDSLRHKLRGLFTPTEADEAHVEAVIAARGRELELQTERLAETIADLERREEQTRRLRLSVEDTLRRGSAELDDRHAELNELAAELTRREEDIVAAEHELAERRRELGAVELRRAATERREEAAHEREEALQRIAIELNEREHRVLDAESKLEEILARETELDTRGAELARLASEHEEALRVLSDRRAALEEAERRIGDLRKREEELNRILARLDARERELEDEQNMLKANRKELERAVAAAASGLGLAAFDAAAPALPSTHLRLVSDGGYRFIEADGLVPAAGSVVEIEGTPFSVVRAGRSPLPGDARLCAYLLRTGSPEGNRVPG